MRAAEKILLVAGLGREVYGTWRFQRVVSIVAVVLVLGFIAALLLAATAIGGVVAAYLYLIADGLAPGTAALLSSLLALLLAGALIMGVRAYVSKLHMVARTPVRDAVDAFLDGLFARRK